MVVWLWDSGARWQCEGKQNEGNGHNTRREFCFCNRLQWAQHNVLGIERLYMVYRADAARDTVTRVRGIIRCCAQRQLCMWNDVCGSTVQL